MGELSDAQARLIDEATAASAGSASLSDIQHVVILMQENRAFDHYFGTLSGVRGFSDPDVISQSAGGRSHPVFDQFGYQPGKGIDASGYLQPFRLYGDPPRRDGQAINDISHSWLAQHHSWNGGAMDRFVATHAEIDGAENGPVTMGYYTRADLPFYYALADAFTICDGYFGSVIGSTDPNRLMGISASIDPDGVAGGPVVDTFNDRVAEYGKLTWALREQNRLTPDARCNAVPGLTSDRDSRNLTGLRAAPRIAGMPPAPHPDVLRIASGPGTGLGRRRRGTQLDPHISDLCRCRGLEQRLYHLPSMAAGSLPRQALAGCRHDRPAGPRGQGSSPPRTARPAAFLSCSVILARRSKVPRDEQQRCQPGQRDSKADTADDYHPSRHDRGQVPRDLTNSEHPVTPTCLAAA